MFSKQSKYYFTVIALFVSLSLFSQDEQRIESLKIGFFTEKLDLTPKESEAFWPLYRSFKGSMNELKKENRGLSRRVRLLSDEEELESIFEEFLANKEEEISASKKFHQDLAEVLPRRKAILVFFVEREFNAKLLQSIRKNRKN